jgi:hypothetical protein
MKRVAWKRMAYLAFAHVLLVFAPGSGNARVMPISPPTNFTGTAISSTSIQWSWNTVLGATHYELQVQGTNFVIVSIPAPPPGTPSMTFLETGLAAGSTECRHVVAFSFPDTPASTADVCVTTPQEAQFTELTTFKDTRLGTGSLKIEQGTGANKNKLRITFPGDPTKPRIYTVVTKTITLGTESVTIFTANLGCVPIEGGGMFCGILFLVCVEATADCPVDQIKFTQTIKAGTIKCDGMEEPVPPKGLDPGTGATVDNPSSGPTAKSADNTKKYFVDFPGRTQFTPGTTCVHELLFDLCKWCDMGAGSHVLLGCFTWFVKFTVTTPAGGGEPTVTYDPTQEKGKEKAFEISNVRTKPEQLKEDAKELNKLLGRDFFSAPAKK